jgi:hypothetical protein
MRGRESIELIPVGPADFAGGSADAEAAAEKGTGSDEFDMADCGRRGGGRRAVGTAGASGADEVEGSEEPESAGGVAVQVAEVR